MADIPAAKQNGYFSLLGSYAGRGGGISISGDTPLESKALQFRHRYSQYLEKMQTGNLNLLKVPILYTRDFHTLRIYQDTFIIFKHSTRNLDASPAKSKQRHTNAAVLSIFANQTSHWFFHSAPSHSCLTVSLVTAPLSLSAAAEAVNWLVSAPVSAGLARCGRRAAGAE